MKFEGGLLHQPSYPSLESLKETYKNRLDSIIYKQLTVENIGNFADSAILETVQLIEDILKQYKNNPEIEGNPTLKGKMREDDAFERLELPNIEEILESIISVKEKIEELKEYIGSQIEEIDRVITPPQPDYPTAMEAGNGESAGRRMFPRLLTLMYIIEHDFSIEAEEVSITSGKVIPDMMRKTPYIRVEIPELERVVYICDEEGNVSYIFDENKFKEIGLTIEELDIDSKVDKNALINSHPGLGVRIIQSSNWRSRVLELLEGPISVEGSDDQTKESPYNKSISEFEQREKRWLPFEDFQAEVRASYTGQVDVAKWYREEYKNHPNWSSHPNVIYKDKGWVGFPELVGIENRKKKEFLPFEDFQAEVRALYTGQVDVRRWYREEYKNHPNLPAAPNKIYKDKGWVGFPELVGKK